MSALSVDLFDTLLLRAVASPSDVFPRVAEEAVRLGHIHGHITKHQFRVIRTAAEETARRKKRVASGSSEVTLEDIYTAFPAGILLSTPRSLARLERRVDGELVFPHPGILNLVLRARAQGLRTAILSDTFYSADDVHRLLQAAGIDPRVFDVVLTSADAGVSKRDGGLFPRLLDTWSDVPAGRIVHVGDHQYADVMRARAAGLAAVPHDTGQRELLEARRLEELRYGDAAGDVSALRQLAATLPSNAPFTVFTDECQPPPRRDEERWWFTLGAIVLGPVLAAFADWVVASCARERIAVVRPLMREGRLLADMISRAAERAGHRLDVRPLFASRASTWLAGITAFGDAHARQLLQRPHLTVAEALTTLGLNPANAHASLLDHLDRRLGELAGSADGSHGSVEDALLAFLGRADVRVEIDYHAARARRLVRQYVEQECGEAHDVAIVDIGFRGTTGAALERAHAGTGRRFHQFLLFGAEAVTRIWAAGGDVRVYAAGPGHHADLAGSIVRHPAVLEALLVDGGTTTGYRLSHDVVTPVLGTSLVPPEQPALTAACRQGIEAFQACWLDWRRLRPRAAAEIVATPRPLAAMVHRLLTMPTAEEAKRLGTLWHEDNDGGAAIRQIGGPMPENAPPATELLETTDTSERGSSVLWPSWNVDIPA